MALHPQAQAWLDELAASGGRPYSEVGAAAARRIAESRLERCFPEVVEVARVEDADADGVPVRVYRPAEGELPALVWLHGGGWVVGSVALADRLCRALAAGSGCAVCSVDYRLAPEHPYPAAVEDAWTATRWAAGRFPRLAVGGDSAGGNLAAVVARRARAAELPLALQLLVYPITDCDLGRGSYAEWGEGTTLTRDGMAWFWEQYLPDEARRAEPEASPLRAPDLAGLAPAWVLIAECDPLRDEGVAYAERLRAAGVATELLREPGQIHGFFGMPGVIDAARPALGAAAAALRAALAP